MGRINFVAEIRRLSRQIQKKYSPEKIILFGSCSRKDSDDYSDIDMLIVKDTGQRFLDRIKEVLEICDYRIAFDPLVYTPRELRQLRKESSFIKRVLREGKVLYERK